MPKVIFIDHKGEQITVDVPIGLSLMHAAVDNAISGIDGDCGGVCGCATCHVFVEPSWFPKLGELNDKEKDMLGFTAAVQDNSRLACQIKVTDAMDGIVVRLPESQH
ncbi:MAG: 2Fe-2S iron-sulfur cluster binding domain-containing protein [Burkholderiales bacterium]|nr:2Fe-2S iron-sulfur cluster binding domain-containing protein [Burkholderiales bacterium]